MRMLSQHFCVTCDIIHPRQYCMIETWALCTLLLIRYSVATLHRTESFSLLTTSKGANLRNRYRDIKNKLLSGRDSLEQSFWHVKQCQEMSRNVKQSQAISSNFKQCQASLQKFSKDNPISRYLKWNYLENPNMLPNNIREASTKTNRKVERLPSSSHIHCLKMAWGNAYYQRRGFIQLSRDI